MLLRPIIYTFIKFSLVGVINTTTTYAIFALAIKFGVGDTVALALGYGVGMMMSYVGNSFWTFRDAQQSYRRFLLFLFVNVLVLFASEVSLHVITIFIYANQYIAQLINTIPMLIIGFGVNRMLVFRRRDAQ